MNNARSKPVTGDQFQSLMGSLQRHKADFIVVGGQALLLNGSSRFTEDIDILCPDRGADRLLRALSEIPESGLSPDDDPKIIAHDKNEKHDVVRINGEYTTDVMYSCSGYTYEQMKEYVVLTNGIPHLGLEGMLKMKQGDRPKDILDRMFIEKALAFELDTGSEPSV